VFDSTDLLTVFDRADARDQDNGEAAEQSMIHLLSPCSFSLLEEKWAQVCHTELLLSIVGATDWPNASTKNDVPNISVDLSPETVEKKLTDKMYVIRSYL